MLEPEWHAGLHASRAADARAALAGADSAQPPSLSFPGRAPWSAAPSGAAGPAGRQGARATAGAGRGARGAEPGAPGRADRRRKPGREAGGGAAALSHSGLTRPPLPGAEVTAGPGRAAAAARRAEGPPGGGEQVRGRPGLGGEPRSEFGGGGRRGPAPERRAARQGLPHLCPGGRGAPAFLGALGSTVRAGPVGSPGVVEAGWPAVRGMQTWAF